MDRTNSTNNSQENSKLDRAENAVVKNVERFESAMEDLANKVEDSSHRLEHTMELANKSKDDLLRVKNSIVSSVEPLKPYIRRASDSSRRVATQARENPRPFIMGAVGIIGGLLLLSYFQSRRSSTRMNYSGEIGVGDSRSTVSTTDQYVY